MVALVWTMLTLAAVAGPPAHPGLVLDVTGRQWWWEVRYNADSPPDVFETANEIHIPVGVPVLVRLHGGDVIHSFWVPQLSGKTDAIPGQTNLSWIEADKPGRIPGAMHGVLRLSSMHTCNSRWWPSRAREFDRWECPAAAIRARAGDTPGDRVVWHWWSIGVACATAFAAPTPEPSAHPISRTS